MMKELVGEMVHVIVDLVTSKLSQESTVQTGSGTQSQEQDAPSVPVANVVLPTNSEHTTFTCTSDDLQQTSVASQNETRNQGNNIDIHNVNGPLHAGRPLHYYM